LVQGEKDPTDYDFGKGINTFSKKLLHFSLNQYAKGKQDYEAILYFGAFKWSP